MQAINKRLVFMNRVFFIVAFAIFSCSANAQIPSQKKNPNDLEMDPSVRIGKLENGFTYYLYDNDSETTFLQMVVKAGIYQEEKDQVEYAHLTEHMVFKYPPHFPDEDKYFETDGRYKHAATSFDFTSYNVRIPSRDKTGIKNGLQLLRDWAYGVNFNQEAIDIERGAILGEGRVNDPHTIWINEKIENLILSDTPIQPTSRKTIAASIKNFNRSAFLKFYRKWYRPDMEAAIVVGDIDLDSTEIKIRQLFSDLKNPIDFNNPENQLNKYDIQLGSKNRYFRISDTLRKDSSVEIVSVHQNPGFVFKTKDDYKEKLLQQLYERIISARSKPFAQQYLPPFKNFTANYAATTVGGGRFHTTKMEVDFKNMDFSKAYNHFQNALMTWKIMHHGVITDVELEAAKREIKKLYSLEDFKKSIRIAHQYTLHFVRGSVPLPPEGERKLIEKILAGIQSGEMNNFIHQYGDLSKNKVFLFFKGEENINISLTGLRKSVSEVVKREVVRTIPPSPKLKTLENIANFPIQEDGVVVSQSKNLINVTTINLNNGIKLVLKPTTPASDFFSGRVSLHGFQQNNISFDDRMEYLSGVTAPEAIQFMGAGSYTKFDIANFEKDKEMELRFKIDNDFKMIDGASPAGNISELLNLLYLYVEKPRIDTLAFKAWKDYKMEEVKGNSPRGNTGFLMKEINARWYPEVPQLTSKELDTLSITRISNAYQKEFSDLSGFTFIITGDFDVDSLKQVLIDKFSSFTPKNRQSKPRALKLDFPMAKTSQIIRLNNINQAYVRLYFPIYVSTDIKTQVALDLLAEALNEKIWDRLRAGCYNPYVQGNWINKKKGLYGFMIAFDSDLGMEGVMIRNALEEFSDIRRKGLTQEWLDLHIPEDIRSFDRKIDSFGFIDFWQEYLRETLSNHEDPEKVILRYGPTLKHFITREDVNEAAKKYFTTNNLQEFVILPESYQVKKELIKSSIKYQNN